MRVAVKREIAIMLSMNYNASFDCRIRFVISVLLTVSGPTARIDYQRTDIICCYLILPPCSVPVIPHIVRCDLYR